GRGIRGGCPHPTPFALGHGGPRRLVPWQWEPSAARGPRGEPQGVVGLGPRRPRRAKHGDPASREASLAIRNRATERTAPPRVSTSGVPCRTMAADRGRDVGAIGREALAYADALHNLARYLTGNQPDAEDLVQETYARALRSLHQFTPGTTLKAWLCRILRNTFLSEYRRRRGSPVVGGLDTVAPHHDVADRDLDALRKVMAD